MFSVGASQSRIAKQVKREINYDISTVLEIFYFCIFGYYQAIICTGFNQIFLFSYKFEKLFSFFKKSGVSEHQIWDTKSKKFEKKLIWLCSKVSYIMAFADIVLSSWEKLTQYLGYNL